MTRWAVGTVVALLLLMVSVLEANKYSSALNNNSGDNAARKFRMRKVNLIWEKAQKKLSQNKLDMLYTDLLLQDKLELQAKKAAVAGSDQDGDHMAVARKHLLSILHTYGLDNHFDDRASNQVHGKYGLDATYDSSFKKDEKLDRLWKKAQASGYTDSELQLLKKEFAHYQEKKEEYNLLKTEVDSFLDISENAIHGHLSEEDDWKTMKKKKKLLKEKHHDLKNHYENLMSKSEETGTLKAKFEEPKVVELWALALKGNFTEDELLSLKEELSHFEHKVKKQKHLEEQVDLSSAAYHRPGKTNELPEQHLQMEEKLRNYKYRVKKFHHELKSKIVKAYGRHSEL